MPTSRCARLVTALLTAALIVGGASAPAAAATVAITSFKVGPAVIAATGGKTTFTVRTSGATSCSIASSPKVKGLPAGVACASGKKTISIPGAVSTSTRRFVFTLTARNRAGLTTTAKVSLSRAASLPAIVKLTRSITSGAKTDSLKIAATVRYAKTCTLAVSPTVAGLPNTANCAKGSYARTSQIPKNHGSTARTYTIKLSATSPTGVTRSKTVTISQPGENATVPGITKYSVTPSTLSAAGGTYTVQATVQHATTCTLQVTPALASQPSPAECAGGSYRKELTIPANSTGGPRTYTFDFTASNSVGSASAKITATQPAAAPSISGFSAAPTPVPAGGGSLTVSATIAFGSTCTLTSDPDLPSTPIECDGTVSSTVTVPQNTATSGRTYTFTLSVTGPGGTATGTISVAQAGTPVPAPAITAFALSPSTVPYTAGTYAVSGTVANATSCTFTTTPDLGSPTTPVDCSSGTFSRSISIPANTGAKARQYALTFVAQGAGGTANQTIHLTQPPAPPAVTLSANPPALPAAGATITLSGTIARGGTCTLTSNPAVTGSTAAFDCTAGTLSRMATISANNTPTTKNYTFTLSATGDGGSANTTLTLVQPSTQTAAPSVTNFTSSPSAVGAGGATLTLTATVANAATCTFTPPAALGAPSTTSCTGASFSTSVVVPANTTGATKTFVFALKATGNGSATATLSLTQLPTAPAVTAFSATPTTVTASGGTPTFAATITNAKTCTFTSNPAISGSTAPFDCTGGSFSRAVTITPNSTGASRSFTFTISATGPGGSAGRSLTLTQPAAAPTVSGPTVTPSSVTANGGQVTIAATVTNASTCALTSSPDLGISGTPVSCSNGSFSRVVTVAQNTSTSARSYVLTLSVTGSGGTATGTLTLTQPGAAPVITNYAANPTTISSSGGPLTLSAAVANATTCTFTPTASLGVASMSSCSTGTFSRSVTIPANTTGSTRAFSFTLDATGPGGTASQTLTLQQLTQPAGVSNPTITPATLTAAGGNVTIGATITNATSCTLTSTPDLGLSPAPFACNGNFSKVIAIPNNATVTEHSYALNLRINGAGGAATAGYTVKVPAAAPTLTNYQPSTASIPAGGLANLTISATIGNAVTCTFTPSASLGAPYDQDCTGASTFSSSGSIPANNTGASRQLSFTLKVSNSGGSASLTIVLTQPST